VENQEQGNSLYCKQCQKWEFPHAPERQATSASVTISIARWGLEYFQTTEAVQSTVSTSDLKVCGQLLRIELKFKNI